MFLGIVLAFSRIDLLARVTLAENIVHRRCFVPEGLKWNDPLKLLEDTKSMTFKELAKQTVDTIQGRQAQVRLPSGEAEPRAREEPGWKGRQDEGQEKQQRVGTKDSSLDPDWV